MPAGPAATQIAQPRARLKYGTHCPKSIRGRYAGVPRMPGGAPGQVFDFVPFDPGYNRADGSREIGMAHGLYVDGVWRSEWYDTAGTGGRFVPAAPVFRNWITPDGSAGPSGTGGFPAERGRYHLYVSLACPYAHRTVIFRRLKQLEDVISMSVLDPVMGDQGWQFGDGPGTTPDSVNGARRLGEIYLFADPRYTGRVSVPVLWDRERRTIVNNESPEIIRMLNAAFAALTDDRADYYPAELREQIDAINTRVYGDVNIGVYRAGFATAQPAYEEGCRSVFAALDWLENILSRQRYLAGAKLTEADWRLFTTLVRFDAVYYGHFKCNLRRIADYPALSNYLRDLYQVPGIAGTVNIDHIKRHYYMSMTAINPTRIVPLGPDLDFSVPHDREKFAPAAR